MRKAYALLGLAFLIVFGGAFVIFEQAHAPEHDEEKLSADNRNDMTLTLTSSAFEHNGSIPSLYTCDGANTMPPLMIAGAPEGTTSFVLLMDDLDIPAEIAAARSIERFDHFAVYNIPAETTVLETEDGLGMPALNGRGEEGYVGPCPPTEYEPREHRYVFRLYALKETLSFQETPTLDELEEAARPHALEHTELIGRYQRE